MPRPILPIDTVQAVVHSAFPWLLRRLRKDSRAVDIDARTLSTSTSSYATLYRERTDAAVRDPRVLLDDPDALTTWMGLRFALDGVAPGSVLNPFLGSQRSHVVVASAQWTRTYGVYADGIVLPRHHDGLPADDRATGEPAELAKGTPWILTGDQIALLRAAASVATAKLWLQPDFGVGSKHAYASLVRGAYLDVSGTKFPSDVNLRHCSINGRYVSESRGYYNPEDGAGYFDRRGYVLFDPPPPPALTGWVAPDGDVWGGQKDEGLVPCGLYASNNAYATDCTCVTSSVRFFRPEGPLRGEAPPESSEAS